ncbi:MAG: cytochrome c [Burkholderiales bacterium]|nr:cytochrome c [Burkholderiales bacterium]
MNTIEQDCQFIPACGNGPTRRATALRHLGLFLLGGGMSLAAAVPAGAADVIKGAQIYARHCASCHGPNGISVMPGAPHLARGERMMQPDLALLSALKAGKNAMPAYIGILADRDILDVIAYSRTLRK